MRDCETTPRHLDSLSRESDRARRLTGFKEYLGWRPNHGIDCKRGAWGDGGHHIAAELWDMCDIIFLGKSSGRRRGKGLSDMEYDICRSNILP